MNKQTSQKLQVILTYDFLFENRHSIFNTINTCVQGIGFSRASNAAIINPILTEVLHATLHEAGGYVELREKLRLLPWDFPDCISLFVRVPGFGQFESFNLWDD